MIKIVSGGQTGVDRAALDAAIKAGVPCGGWCPAGRLAEDGVIPPEYDLKETPTNQYPQRTEWNVRDSGGTLIITTGEPTGGTAFTIACARKLGRPYLVADPGSEKSLGEVSSWLEECNIKVLNVAGPRESSSPGMYGEAYAFLLGILTS